MRQFVKILGPLVLFYRTTAAGWFFVSFQFSELTKTYQLACRQRAVFLTSGRLYMSYRTAIATGRIASSTTHRPNPSSNASRLSLSLSFLVISSLLPSVVSRLFLLPGRRTFRRPAGGQVKRHLSADCCELPRR